MAFRDLLDLKYVLTSKNARVRTLSAGRAGNAVARLEDYLDGRLADQVAHWQRKPASS